MFISTFCILDEVLRYRVGNSPFVHKILFVLLVFCRYDFSVLRMPHKDVIMAGVQKHFAVLLYLTVLASNGQGQTTSTWLCETTVFFMKNLLRKRLCVKIRGKKFFD